MEATQPDRSAAPEGRWSLPRRAGWATLCLSGGVLLQSLVHQPIGALIPAGILAYVVITGVRPYYGLLLLAAFGPLSSILFHLGTDATINVQFAETLTLAFITGWAGNRMFRPRPLAVSPGTRWAAVLLLAAAVASGISQWATIRAERLGEPVTSLIQAFITRDYLIHLAGSLPITAAALVCEGALLLLMAADTCAGREDRRDAVLRVMVVGAAAAGVLNVLRIVTASMAQEHAWAALRLHLRTVRVNVQYPDLNAAGSFFALMLVIALGFVARRRILAAACLPPIVAALWITGSRFALGGACLGLGIGTLVALRGRWRRALPVLAGLVLVGAVAGALWRFYPEDRNTGAKKALAIRLILANAGLDMAARHPVFGVGLGRFYAESEPYLRDTTPPIGTHENAHNNFIQILAELGGPGLLIFLATLMAPMGVLWRSARPLPATSIALLAGLLAYLLSCLGGHPLIIPESSYPFWIALGLAASGPATSAVTPRAMRYAALAVVLLFVAAIPARMAAAARSANMAGVSIGLSMWQHEPDGSRFRWAGGRASFFVDASAKAVRLPLRNEHPERIALDVRVFVNGREVDRVRLSPDGRWQVKRLILPRSAGTYARIDLFACEQGADVPVDIQATDRDGAIAVGRPSIEE